MQEASCSKLPRHRAYIFFTFFGWVVFFFFGFFLDFLFGKKHFSRLFINEVAGSADVFRFRFRFRISWQFIGAARLIHFLVHLIIMCATAICTQFIARGVAWSLNIISIRFVLKKPNFLPAKKYLIYVSVVSLQVNYANTLNCFAFCGADRVLRYVPAGVSMHTYSTPIGIQLNVPKC